MPASPEIQKIIDENRPKAIEMMKDEFSEVLNKYGVYISSFNWANPNGEVIIEIKFINK